MAIEERHVFIVGKLHNDDRLEKSDGAALLANTPCCEKSHTVAYCSQACRSANQHKGKSCCACCCCCCCCFTGSKPIHRVETHSTVQLMLLLLLLPSLSTYCT